MPVQVINGVGIAGIRGSGSTQSTSFDSDAQAFITSASLTETTQQNAVNDLVLDLKAAGLWTKMKALYPMVGGTAASHKWNLKDPRDVDAAYRLVFNGGGTHSSTGYLPNGSNTYANTFLTPSTSLTNNSTHVSIYSRTDISQESVDIGVNDTTDRRILLFTRWSDSKFYTDHYSYASNRISTSMPNSLGMFLSNRNSSTNLKAYKNGNVIGTNVNTSSPSVANIQAPIFIGAANMFNGGGAGFFSSRQLSLVSIGDGLTDIESTVFYQIVEKFQYALGRNVNTSQSFYYNRNYTNETNAFIFNGGVTDSTQISAVNTLVSTLKTSGIWSKMKAVYPMVGGTVASHKLNLVNPVNSTSAYALTFYGGWTHSSNGAQPNGTDGYANTNFVASGVLTLHNCHLSYYSRTSSLRNIPDVFMGSVGNYGTWYGLENLYMSTNSGAAAAIQHTSNTSTAYAVGNITNRSGLFINTRTSATPTTLKLIKNGVSLGNATTQDNPYARAIELPIYPIYLAAFNNRTNSPTYAQYFSNTECAFASIGDGLTDAEVTTFYNAVQTFQTTLGRQV